MSVVVRLQRDDIPWSALDFMGRPARGGLLLMARQSPVGKYAVQKSSYRPWFWLVPEVEAWLDEHNADYELRWRPTRKGIKSHWCIVLDREIATLFKLTWGGS